MAIFPHGRSLLRSIEQLCSVLDIYELILSVMGPLTISTILDYMIGFGWVALSIALEDMLVIFDTIVETYSTLFYKGHL